MDRLSAINVILNLVLQFLPRIGFEVDPEPGRVALLEDHLVAWVVLAHTQSLSPHTKALVQLLHQFFPLHLNHREHVCVWSGRQFTTSMFAIVFIGGADCRRMGTCELCRSLGS